MTEHKVEGDVVNLIGVCTPEKERYQKIAAALSAWPECERYQIHFQSLEPGFSLAGCPAKVILADIFEAFMGAICHDCGMKYVDMMLKKTIYRHINDVNYDDITDFKTKLQELIQADQRKTVTYELLSATGPSNNPVFEMAVKMDDMILGTGIGSSKKRAEQQAAKDALNKLAK